MNSDKVSYVKAGDSAEILIAADEIILNDI